MHRLLAPRGRLDLPWYLNMPGSPKEIRQFKCHDGGSTRSVVGQQLEVVEWNGPRGPPGLSHGFEGKRDRKSVV